MKPEDIAIIEDDELLSLHDEVHEMGSCPEARRMHGLVEPEMVRRKMAHTTPYHCEMRGLYLVPPHGEMIADGRKKAVAKSRAWNLAGEWILVSGKKAYGEIELGEPEEVGVEEFDARYGEHKVSRQERLRWWPEYDTLFLFHVKQMRPYSEPRKVAVPPGVQTVMQEVNFNSRADDVVRKLDGLPERFLWIPNFVSLSGSQIYAKDREPNDVDVILRAESEDNGFSIRLPLDASFALKLERILKDMLKAEKVQYTASTYGPNWDHAPLYDLCLVRRPELKVVDVAEREPEFAELEYKTLTKSALDRLLRGATADTKRQAKHSFDENKITPGRAFVPLKPLRTAPEGERQVVSNFYKYIDENLDFPLYLSAKRDGYRATIHRREGKVVVFSDDGKDTTETLPHLVKRFEKFGQGDWIIDAELELWKDGQHYPREAASGVVHSGEGDEDIAANIFRLLHWGGEDLHDEPFSEVWTIMAKMPTDTKSDGKLYPRKDGPINLVPHYHIGNLDELKKRLLSTAYKPGVEGVVVKRADGTYPLDGNPGKPPTSVKWHKSFEAVAEVTGKTETKTKGVFVYNYSLGDMEAGKTFGSATKLNIGDRFVIEGEQLNLEKDDAGETVKVSIWVPELIEPTSAKAETLKTVISRARKQGVLQEKIRHEDGSVEYLPTHEGEPGTADKAKHSRSRCMACKAPPEVDVHWADGRGRAWFCLKHFREWIAEDQHEIVRAWFVEDDEVPKKLDEHKRRNQVRTLGSGVTQSEILARIEKLKAADKALMANSKAKLEDYPDENLKLKYVAQEHARGRSCHLDMRFEYKRGDSHHLRGWTVMNQQPSAIKEPITTLEALRQAVRNPRNWKMDMKTGLIKEREIRGGVTRRGSLRATRKAAEVPKDWMYVEGVTEKPEPGEPIPAGATREYPGVFLIISKGPVSYGAIKPWLQEYFLDGTWKGRWLFRLIERKGEKYFAIESDDEAWDLARRMGFKSLNDFRTLPVYLKQDTLPPGVEEERPREGVYWLLMQPKDQTPYVLDKDAIDKNWLPPKGVSCLPPKLRKSVPKNLRYWEMDRREALEARKELAGYEELGGTEIKAKKPAGPGRWVTIRSKPIFIGGATVYKTGLSGGEAGRLAAKVEDWESGPRKEVAEKAIIAAEAGMSLIALEEAGELKGVLTISRRTITSRQIPEFPKGEYRFLEHLATAEKGYGRSMMQEAVNLAAEAGIGLALNSTRNAQGFYRKLGMHWNQDSEYPQFHWSPSEVSKQAIKKTKALPEVSDEDEPENGVFVRLFKELAGYEELGGTELKKQVGKWRPYCLQRHTWKGQVVIRFGPSTEHHDLRVKLDGKQWHLVLDGNPLEKQPLAAYEESKAIESVETTDGKRVNVFDVTKVELTPSQPANPTKDTPAFLETIDKGQCRILSDKPEFRKLEFKGGKLKGAWVFRREEPSSDLGEFMKSAGPETKEANDMQEITMLIDEEQFEEKQAGGPEMCVCPACGKEVKHERGTPCRETKCPKCDTAMVAKTAITAEQAVVGTEMERAVVSSVSGALPTLIKEFEEKLPDFDSLEEAYKALGLEVAEKAEEESHDTEEADAKVGKRVRGDKLEALRKLKKEWEDFSAAFKETWGKFIQWAGYEDEAKPYEFLPTDLLEAGQKALSESGSLGFAFKARDGKTWWLQFTTNAFQDREREIFTTKSIDDYVERHRGDAKKGEFWYRHIPGTKFADVLWQAVVGRFLAQAGPFDDAPVGQAFKEFFLKYPWGHPAIAPRGWGPSHGYHYKSEDRKDGVYNWFEIRESTVLPKHLASNPWSPMPLIMEAKKMNEQEKKELEEIGGQSLLDLVLQAQEKTKLLETEGVAFKASWAAQIKTIAGGVKDDALKKRLTDFCEKLEKAYPYPRPKGEKEAEAAEEPPPEAESAEDDDEKAGKLTKLGQELRLLSGKVGGEAGKKLRAIADDMLKRGGGEYPKAEKEDEDSLSREEVAEAMKAVMDVLRTEISEAAKTSVEETTKAVTETLQPLVEEIKQLRKSDLEKVAETIAQTPAASLKSLLELDAKVAPDDELAKKGPKEAEPLSGEGLTGLFIDRFVTSADQRKAAS